jgi:hypothetical protein
MNAFVPTVCSIACFAFGKEKSLGRPARGRDATTTRRARRGRSAGQNERLPKELPEDDS